MPITRREISQYVPGRESTIAEDIDLDIGQSIIELDALINDEIRKEYGVDITAYNEEEDIRVRSRIVRYIADLADDKNTMTFGKAIRRYICKKYGIFDENENKYIFVIDNIKGKTQKIIVSDYSREDYDIQNDEIKEYNKIWRLINDKYNRDINNGKVFRIKGGTTRFLTAKTPCSRKMMFQIGFSLHMTNFEMSDFLTNTLAEPSYNYRDPLEIIFHYCQSSKSDEVNNYSYANGIFEEYKILKEKIPEDETCESGYSDYAVRELENRVESEQQLFDFLLKNRSQFGKCSETARKAFEALFNEAFELSEDFFVKFHDDVRIGQGNNAEALSKAIFDYGVPRVINNDGAGDFEHIIDSTKLYHEIMEKPLFPDRIRNIRNGKIRVEKKDLVLLYFYIYCRRLENVSVEPIPYYDYDKFRSEINAILNSCGMSGLYALNKFDNLIMMAFWSVEPYVFFLDILLESFSDGNDDLFEEGDSRDEDLEELRIYLEANANHIQ